MKRPVFLAALALTALPAASHAEDADAFPQLAELVFGSIEANPNGLIDQGEFFWFADNIFASMDSDGDGVLMFEEFTAFDFGFRRIAEETDQLRAYETAQRILYGMWDRDGDNLIDRREYHASMTVDFLRADSDRNALLTREEFLQGYIVSIAYRSALTGDHAP